MRIISPALARTRAGLAKLHRGGTAAAVWLWDQLPETLMLAGGAAITYGVANVSRPAGWITGGVLTLVAGYRLGRPIKPPEVRRG
jgi:hypothetical protein